jgi:uncharacterized damage-inducible protein DinB
MSLVGYFRTMARNNAWSNHRLLATCAGLSPEELDAKRTSFIPSLRLTLNHILLVDGYYLDALEGMPSTPDLDESATPWGTFEELRAAQRESDRRLIRFCDELQPATLTGEIVLDRGGGVRPRERVDRTLAHLFVHQIHHRGQAHAMLAGTSVAPPQLDEFLLASDAPLRAGDLAALGLEDSETWLE